ncbi:MAG: CoA transferase, partial [Rickettsiales bacterium]
HIQASGMLTEVDYPGMAKAAPITSTPVKLLKTPGEIRHRAPLLGEHTEEVLASLGYGAEEIAALKQNRIV